MRLRFISISCLIMVSVLSLLTAAEGIACTTAIVSAGASETGRPLLWKQRDTSDPFNEVRYIRGAGYDYVAVFNCKDSRSNSAFVGVNSVGFAVMNNQSYNIGDASGDHNGVIMRLALEKCSTVDEFEAFLKENPGKYRFSANFGAIDAYGGAAYIEAGGDKCVRYDVPEGSWLVRTNYSLSGDDRSHAGSARYRTAEYIMTRHNGKFGVEDLINGLGRSYYNDVTGVNALHGSKVALDRDFIARPSTVSSVCVEGVTGADRKDASIMWSATGYTPCCYAVPVWVAAGDEIPSFLTSPNGSDAISANKLAYQLKNSIHQEDLMKEYVDFRLLKPVLRKTRKAEKTELKLGYETDARIRKSFDINMISAFNREAEKRFEAFKEDLL